MVRVYSSNCWLEYYKKMEKVYMFVNWEEKVLVLVRLRFLNKKEIVVNEVMDWECINDIIILYRNILC